MYEQMNIFDFIENPNPPAQVKLPARTQFERLFEKIKDPVVSCANCLCQYCVNNVEEVWDRVKPEEVQGSCFNCDECRFYSGDRMLKSKRKEKCGNFVMSDYGAERNRKKFKVLRGGKDSGN